MRIKKKLVLLFFFLVLGLSMTKLLISRSTPEISVKRGDASFGPTAVAATQRPQGDPFISDESTSARYPASESPQVISENDILNLRKNYPSQSEVEKEFQEYPHYPSRKLMIFARSLGPLIDKAQNHRESALLLSQEFSRCAVDDSVHEAARALCVQDIELLQKTYPELEERAKSLRSEVSPEVLRILETNDRFTKKE